MSSICDVDYALLYMNLCHGMRIRFRLLWVSLMRQYTITSLGIAPYNDNLYISGGAIPYYPNAMPDVCHLYLVDRSTP